MAIKKVKLPNNTTLDIHDARVVSDAIAYIGAQQGSATYVDGGTIIDVTTKADKVIGATSGNFAGLDNSGNLTDSGHKHSDYQVALVSGTNIKTINNQSLLGSGNITIQGGSGGSGTVTSVAMSVPTGLSVSGSPITTSGTLEVSLASGYSIPTTTKQSEWDNKQAALVSGTNIKTINSQSILGSGNINISASTTDCVHVTGDETVGGDKTFTDNIAVVDADHIVYSGGGGGGGFTKGVKTFGTISGQTITFTGLSGEPKAFVLSAITDSVGRSNYTNGVVSVVMDSTGCRAIYNTGTQHNYSSAFSKSYSNGTLVITAPSGVTWPSSGNIEFGLVYYYGNGNLTFRTSTIQPGSGVTSVTFTGTELTEVPAVYACFLESAVNSESYRRVALYTNSALDEGDTQVPLGITFYSQLMTNTTSSFTVTYQTGYSAGLNINSGGTNAGGYFHNLGTYTLYYLMASDVAGGGSGGYQSLGDELDDKYTLPSSGIPKSDLASAVQTSLGKADTALQSYTETDPTVPSWAKASSKPTYTASEVGALPDTTVVPTESTVSGWGFTKNAGTITGITMNGSSKGTSGVVNLGTVVTSESDPVFTASAAHGISSTDISNWNAKQKAITVSSSAPTSSQGSNGDIWIVIGSSSFALSGSGTSADPIVGWYENVAKVVNPNGASSGTFTGTLPGIYNYFKNSVTTIDQPEDYVHYHGNTTFLEGELRYHNVVTSGDNININYTEGNQPYLINTNTYQKKGTVVIYPTDLVEFNLKED